MNVLISAPGRSQPIRSAPRLSQLLRPPLPPSSRSQLAWPKKHSHRAAAGPPLPPLLLPSERRCHPRPVFTPPCSAGASPTAPGTPRRYGRCSWPPLPPPLRHQPRQRRAPLRLGAEELREEVEWALCWRSGWRPGGRRCAACTLRCGWGSARPSTWSCRCVWGGCVGVEGRGGSARPSTWSCRWGGALEGREGEGGGPKRLAGPVHRAMEVCGCGCECGCECGCGWVMLQHLAP